MRRHLLVGRMGPLDKVLVPKATDEVLTELALVTGKKRLDFGIGTAIADLTKLGVFPTEIGLDLLVLAAHVHAADTRISRASESQDGWSREIRLVVPVSDVARWSGAGDLLTQMLNFLTGDYWELGFRGRPPGFAKLIPSRPSKSVMPAFDRVNLFSGGLDSLIGAIEALEDGGTPLLVSHAGEGAVSQAQARCHDGLVSAYGQARFDRLRVWMTFPKELVKGVKAENSTRGRSFLFFAAAVFAASGLKFPFRINVPENGFIALNVPLDPLRLGALSTRTTHPFYMARWNDLIAAMALTGRLHNPHWNQTKGEMVRACKNPTLLKTMVPLSMSCASPTKGRWAGYGIGHCGYCLPCIIRRAALRGGDPTSYTMGICNQTLDTETAEGQQVRSFQFAAARLKAKPQLAAALIHKSGPLKDETAHLADLADVYRRGLAEVAAVLNNVKAKPR
ncbi:MAG: hypothetical protein PCFJNLEI_04211 [Verrucomicrobiae bacterium]|nr:hypothetical protein [Verrucomicrobiae bacterium]